LKQILQSLKSGQTSIEEIPVAILRSNSVAVRTRQSLVSAGTERMLVDFGKANWLNKARQQPEKVRMVLDKIRTDGLATTLDAVQSKLDQPLTLGYCNVGKVSEVGSNVIGFEVGDRVVSNGNHAEVVSVSQNLCARIPDCVTDEQASFTVLASIGLQGIRLVNPTLGECIVVTGLGLIGLLTVQMLRAQGCRVLGIDYDASRLKLARQFGADIVNPATGEDVLVAADTFSRGRGVDAVIITASTKSNDPMSQAAKMCRKRGRIVLVGVVGLELSRSDFYEKELTFQVSCSYGPGRYDPAYEENGQDYPLGFVRWTEQRNFEAVLDLLAAGSLDVTPLISHRFELEQAGDAYDLLSSGAPSLGILIEYPTSVETQQRTVSLSLTNGEDLNRLISSGDSVRVGFLGAGNYAGRVLIPAFQKSGLELHTLVSGGGVSAVHYGKKFGFRLASTDSSALLADSEVNAVVIATRHNAHAKQIVAALGAGKHVFVEKPLCLTTPELELIQAAYVESNNLLLVGFNRRFAPQVVKTKSLLDGVPGPKSFVMTVNAGAIPVDHWTQDLSIGGGRLLGEACHFVDLLRHLAGASIKSSKLQELNVATRDTFTITLSFADGSIGTVHYFANGSKQFPKERLEVFAGGRVLQLDNFRKLTGFGWPGFNRMNLWRQDKGQNALVSAFAGAIREGKQSPIPADELFEVMRVCLELAKC
jgi:predicted dehydrogenase